MQQVFILFSHLLDDSSRVKLSIIHGSPYDDYINANYMPVRTDALLNSSLPQSLLRYQSSLPNHITTHSFCSMPCFLNYSTFVRNAWESPRKLNRMDVVVSCICWVDVSSHRVTTPGRSILRPRVLCPPQSASSGGWSGRRTCRPWSCWHAVMNKDEWVGTQTQHLAATCVFTFEDTLYVFPSISQHANMLCLDTECLIINVIRIQLKCAHLSL